MSLGCKFCGCNTPDLSHPSYYILLNQCQSNAHCMIIQHKPIDVQFQSPYQYSTYFELLSSKHDLRSPLKPGNNNVPLLQIHAIYCLIVLIQIICLCAHSIWYSIFHTVAILPKMQLRMSHFTIQLNSLFGPLPQLHSPCSSLNTAATILSFCICILQYTYCLICNFINILFICIFY